MPERRRLPNRRPNMTVPIADSATGRWHLTVGFDREGEVREIFLDRAGRAGSEFDGLVHDACILISREILQRGRKPIELLRSMSERPPSLFSGSLSLAIELQKKHGAEIAARYVQLEEELSGHSQTTHRSAARPAPADQATD
jgi:hypothetical protein